VRHDQGIAASHRVWHKLEVERTGGRSPLLAPCVPLSNGGCAKFVSRGHDADYGEYPDIDMMFTAGRYAAKGSYRHKDGTPY
jgi:hypothetical protein